MSLMPKANTAETVRWKRNARKRMAPNGSRMTPSEAKTLNSIFVMSTCSVMKKKAASVMTVASVEPLSYIHYLTFSGIIGI